MLYVQQVQAGKPRQQCWDLIFLILAVAHMRRPGYYDTASGIDYSANSSQDSKTFTTLQDIYIYIPTVEAITIWLEAVAITVGWRPSPLGINLSDLLLLEDAEVHSPFMC